MAANNAPEDPSLHHVSRRNGRGIFRPRILELWGPQRPAFSWYNEIVAGATVGILSLPIVLAFGVASIPLGTETHLPAAALGLVTAIIAGLLASLLGGTRVQITGPTGAFIPLIIFIIAEHGYGGLIIATIMAGFMLILMGVTGMGRLIKFIPWPVTSGFTTGIAIAIMLGQAPFLLGMPLDPAVPYPHTFLARMQWLWAYRDSFHFITVSSAVVCIGVIYLWPRLRMRRIPGTVAALLLTTLVFTLLGGSERFGVATISSAMGPATLTPRMLVPLLPSFEWNMIPLLMGPAMALALLGAIESMLSAVVADGLSGDRHDSNTELIAQGIANVVCPFFGGLPATGAVARTSANVSEGGKTPLAGIFTALTLLFIVLLAARWAGYVPLAVLAAVMYVVAVRMGEWHEVRRITKMPRSDGFVLLTTCILTVVFNLVVAVKVGIVLAAILFVKRVSETTDVCCDNGDDIRELPAQLAQGKTIPEGVLVYRIFGPFLFGAAEKMEDALARMEKWPRILILRLNLVTAMDTTGMNALESIIERAKHRHCIVLLSGVHHQPLAMLQKADFIPIIGAENVCPTFDDALERARNLITHTS